MTTVAANPRLESQEYRISLPRLEELNRSAAPLLMTRLNAACPSYGKSPSEVQDPATLVNEIRANCADDSEYIQASMPIQEIVFRTMLMANQQTMTLGEIHAELIERWSSPIRPITVSIGGLARILNSDEFYGFDAVPLPEPEIVETVRPALGQADDDPLLAEALAAVLEDDEEDDLYEEDDDDPYEDDDDDRDPDD